MLAQYIRELDAVKLRPALSTVLQISQRGNSFLQSNKLDNNLRLNEPAKCAAVVGLAVNLVHLLASLLSPYMPQTAQSINTQLRAEPLPIPDRWAADSISPNHEIGQAAHLFRRINPEKAKEWREMFGSKEAEKLKEEEAVMKAKKRGAVKRTEVAKTARGLEGALETLAITADDGKVDGSGGTSAG
jgi:methionyl-tRNA synthetase